MTQLDKVRYAAEALVEARDNKEAELRRQLELSLASLKTALDIAAAEAYRSGYKKAEIGRAMKNKDWNTYNGAIARGEALLGEAAHGEHRDAENSVQPAYSFEWVTDGVISVTDGTYAEEFTVVHFDDDSFGFFTADDTLPDNPVRQALDFKFEGEAYKEAVAFVT